uniref:Fibronectin type-III domain-containing protein n=1 Tax=Anopheles atroparvus TaxID=41427 RepID=A0A182J9S4_ANOAO
MVTVSEMGRVVALLLVLLLGSVVVHAAPEIESGGIGTPSPAPRRFHAKFVVDRNVLADRRKPQSTAINPATVSSSTGPEAGLPSVAKIRSTTRCREGCLQKRSIKDILCTQQRECSMCWDVCNRNHQLRKENELAHRLLLSLVRLIRNESVVTADIEWTTPEELVQHQPHPGVPSPLAASENVERLSRIARDGSGQPASAAAVSRIMQTLASGTGDARQQAPVPTQVTQEEYHQCLVSWEISGGGLTGNLLTETSKVELSLWPNTKYHVHVTCRNKETDALIRSSSLLVDTSEAVIVSLQGTTSTTSTTSEPSPPANSAINSPIGESEWRDNDWETEYQGPVKAEN